MISTTSSAAGLDLLVAREVAAMLLADGTLVVALRMYVPASLSLVADVRTERHLSEIADAFQLPLHQIHLQLAVGRWSTRCHRRCASALRSLARAGVGFVLTDVEDPSEVGFAADSAFREVHLSRGLTQAAASDDEAVRAVSEIVERAHGHRILVAATGVMDRLHERTLLRAVANWVRDRGTEYPNPRPRSRSRPRFREPG